jgi:hypothetical protein
LEVGPKEKWLIEQAKRNRMPIPERVMQAPLLIPGLDFYLTAFLTLSSERQVGMGEGRIPWSKTKDYALHYGLDDVEFDILWELITRVDGAYLEWQSKRSRKDAAVKKDSPPEEGRVVLKPSGR